MDVVNLKTQIENKTLDDTMLVLVYEDNSLIVARQYVEEIAKFKGLKIKYVDSTEDFIDYSDTTFGEIVPYYLSVLYIKEFNPKDEDYSKYKNAIVICSKVGKELISEAFNVVVIPKLLDWHITDYIKYKCDGLIPQEIELLQKITNNNIERIDNELSKISIFPKESQANLFAEIDDDGGFGDLSVNTIFNLKDAIIKRNVEGVRRILTEIDSIDVEGVGLVTLLLRDVINVMGIQLDKATMKDLGIQNDNQYKAIGHNCNKYSNESLKKIYEFLIDFDYRLKSGQLQLSNSTMIDYIICCIMSNN